MEVHLLGPVRVVRDGAEVPLPRSRKVRALLAYLALEPSPSSRSRLCDLLWDVPNDPRGELRWCLSKLRGVLDDDDRRRVVTTSQSLISLDLKNCLVDAKELDAIVNAGIVNATTERLEEIASLVRGDFLDGMSVDGAELAAWLFGQRQRHRTNHVAVLSELATRTIRTGLFGSEETFRRLEAWLQRAPFDGRAHELMIEALVKSGRSRDAEAHVNASIRAHEQEGLDWGPLRQAWQAARAASSASAQRSSSAAASTSLTPIPERRPMHHGSVAVMPFEESDSPGASQAVANGLTDDIITRLAKLRVLFVIARGTTYALRERGVDAQEAGRILNVEYIVTGKVRRHGERITVLVELSDSRDAHILWTDEIEGVTADTFRVLDSIVDRIVAAISEEIERAETKRAILKPPSSLDAWEAYHRGLWHMYKITGPDNVIAAKFFQAALDLDPGFARAHAGLSFTHFQNVFLNLTPDRERQMDLALETAGQSVATDDRDPTAHWAMGRALWLRGEHGAIAEIERSVELSPNFALGHYTLGFVQAQSGDPRAAIAAIDHSRELSPFDPLMFGMLGSRALSQMRLGQHEEAAEWSLKAAGRPTAHVHILAIAASTLALANRRDEARAFVARIHEKLPYYTVSELLRAFRFDRDAEKIIRQGAKQIGFE